MGQGGPQRPLHEFRLADRPLYRCVARRRACGLYSPTRTRPTVETEDRKRISGIVSAQWQPTPELQTTLDVVATRLDVAYDEFGLDIYPDDNNVSIGGVKQLPTILQPGYTVVGDTITKATIANARFMASREYSLNRHDLITIGLKQTWNPDRWHVAANVNWSAAHSYHPDYRTGTVRSRAYFIAPLTYDASGGYQNMPTFTTPVDVTNPANYKLYQFNIAPKDSKDWISIRASMSAMISTASCRSCRRAANITGASATISVAIT